MSGAVDMGKVSQKLSDVAGAYYSCADRHGSLVDYFQK